jgi:hypothetical protein
LIELQPVRKKYTKQNFYITRKYQRGGRASDVDCISAFCLTPFCSFTTTKIRVHLENRKAKSEQLLANVFLMHESNFILPNVNEKQQQPGKDQLKKPNGSRMQKKRAKGIQTTEKLLMNPSENLLTHTV